MAETNTANENKSASDDCRPSTGYANWKSKGKKQGARVHGVERIQRAFNKQSKEVTLDREHIHQIAEALGIQHNGKGSAAE